MRKQFLMIALLCISSYSLLAHVNNSTFELPIVGNAGQHTTPPSFSNGEMNKQLTVYLDLLASLRKAVQEKDESLQDALKHQVHNWGFTAAEVAGTLNAEEQQKLADFMYALEEEYKDVLNQEHDHDH